MEAREFQLYKVKQIIATRGYDCTVYDFDRNEFNEPTTPSSHKTFRGLYHESMSYTTKSTAEASTVNKKNCPMLLCVLDDVSDLKVGTQLHVNGKTFELVEIKDINEAGIVADLSLEEVQYVQGV